MWHSVAPRPRRLPLPLPQRALADTEWPAGHPVRVRIGLHTTEATATAEGYVGIGVHRAARICAAAHGGQVVISQTVANLLEDDGAGHSVVDLGAHRPRICRNCSDSSSCLRRG